jgi:hypothetical protein
MLFTAFNEHDLLEDPLLDNEHPRDITGEFISSDLKMVIAGIEDAMLQRTTVQKRISIPRVALVRSARNLRLNACAIACLCSLRHYRLK